VRILITVICQGRRKKLLMVEFTGTQERSEE